MKSNSVSAQYGIYQLACDALNKNLIEYNHNRSTLYWQTIKLVEKSPRSDSSRVAR